MRGYPTALKYQYISGNYFCMRFPTFLRTANNFSSFLYHPISFINMVIKHRTTGKNLSPRSVPHRCRYGVQNTWYLYFIHFIQKSSVLYQLIEQIQVSPEGKSFQRQQRQVITVGVILGMVMYRILWKYWPRQWPPPHVGAITPVWPPDIPQRQSPTPSGGEATIIRGLAGFPVNSPDWFQRFQYRSGTCFMESRLYAMEPTITRIKYGKKMMDCVSFFIHFPPFHTRSQRQRQFPAPY